MDMNLVSGLRPWVQSIIDAEYGGSASFDPYIKRKIRETRILYHESIDMYSVQIKLAAMGWVTVQGFLSKEKAKQVESWLNGRQSQNRN